MTVVMRALFFRVYNFQKAFIYEYMDIRVYGSFFLRWKPDGNELLILSNREKVARNWAEILFINWKKKKRISRRIYVENEF